MRAAVKLIVVTQSISCIAAAEEVEAAVAGAPSPALRGAASSSSRNETAIAAISKCSPPLGDCGASHCCAGFLNYCFETTSNSFSCLSDCVPGVQGHPKGDVAGNAAAAAAGGAWTCKLPFESILAQARESFRWPNVSAICGPSTVLVNAKAFRTLYKGDCMEYCRSGAGRTVHPDFYGYWISVRLEDTDRAVGQCPGEARESHGDAIPCQCSFPDRRI
jgi:hypothetical protein